MSGFKVKRRLPVLPSFAYMIDLTTSFQERGNGAIFSGLTSTFGSECSNGIQTLGFMSIRCPNTSLHPPEESLFSLCSLICVIPGLEVIKLFRAQLS